MKTRKKKSPMTQEFDRIRAEVFGTADGSPGTGGETVFSEPPPPPAHLGEAARAYWTKLAGLLVSRKLLKPAHLEPLATLCDSWETYQTCRAYLGTDLSRWVVTNAKTGAQKESPQVRLMRAALAELQIGWGRFGLTPHSETRLVPERIAARQRTGNPHFDYMQRVAALRDEHDGDFRPPPDLR